LQWQNTKTMYYLIHVKNLNIYIGYEAIEVEF